MSIIVASSSRASPRYSSTIVITAGYSHIAVIAPVCSHIRSIAHLVDADYFLLLCWWPEPIPALVALHINLHALACAFTSISNYIQVLATTRPPYGDLPESNGSGQRYYNTFSVGW